MIAPILLMVSLSLNIALYAALHSAMKDYHCPHLRVRALTNESAIHRAHGRRRSCLDCGRPLDGPAPGE